MTKLSIIIPCFNEAKNIPALIKKIDPIIDENIEVILVDNGSTDKTGEIIELELLNRNSVLKSISVSKNIGYGNGIMRGVKEAKGEIIAWTHADLQTDPADVIDAFSDFQKNPNHKACILKGKRIGRNLFDSFFTFWMGVLSSILMGVRLNDINAQPKIFHRSFLERMDDAPDDFSLDLYLLYQAKANGFNILEYPVYFGKRLHGQAKGGGSLLGKWKLIKRTWYYMNELKQKLGD